MELVIQFPGFVLQKAGKPDPGLETPGSRGFRSYDRGLELYMLPCWCLPLWDFFAVPPRPVPWWSTLTERLIFLLRLVSLRSKSFTTSPRGPDP